MGCTFKKIKSRLKEDISYEEIACIKAHYIIYHKKKNIGKLIAWYQIIHCQRKYFYNRQRLNECKVKFNMLFAKNPTLEMGRAEFVNFFNEHLNICVLSEIEKRKYVSWKQYKLITNK